MFSSLLPALSFALLNSNAIFSIFLFYNRHTYWGQF
uniref:Uncharacterized protein n=1 Tax=Manihot esculenta TaxID=3983 RepID=A0A2C9UZB5_MANES